MEQKLLSARKIEIKSVKKRKIKKENMVKKFFTFNRVTCIFTYFWLSHGLLMSWWINFMTYAIKVIRTNNTPTNGVTGVFYSPALLHQFLVQKWAICHIKCELDPRLGIIWPWNINCNNRRTLQCFIFSSCVCIRALEHNFYAQ